jgi:tetratricopeptide (TPR) repeat protein
MWTFDSNPDFDLPVGFAGGIFGESLGDYNKAIKISGSNADLYYGRSELFAKMNKHREALRDAITATELSPDNNKYREWHKKLTTITAVQ